MTRRCAVVGCDTNRRFYEIGLRFFAFPAGDDAARERWLALIGRGVSWPIPSAPSVCQKHFHPADIPSESIRKLAEDVLPALNLPVLDEKKAEAGVDCLKEEPISDEDQDIAIQKNVEHDRKKRVPALKSRRKKNSPRKKRKASKTKSLNRESDTNCRLCTVKIPSDEGQSVKKLKRLKRVANSIWKICLLDFKSSSFEKCYFQICDDCWQHLTAFGNFAVKCGRKQTKLFKKFEAKEIPEESHEPEQHEQNIKDEPQDKDIPDEPQDKGVLVEPQEEDVPDDPQEDDVPDDPQEQDVPDEPQEQDVPDEPQEQDVSDEPKDQELQDEPSEEAIKIEEVLLDTAPMQVSTDGSSDDEEGEQDLPSLEGLTIVEMIEKLEKIPPGKVKRVDNCVDKECWDCGKVFDTFWEKLKHRKTCEIIGTPESLRNKPYICEICKRNIRTRSGYRLHLVKVHRPDILAGRLECPEELKNLLAKKHLKCPLCTRLFQQVHQLIYHLRTHLNKQLAGIPDVEKEALQLQTISCDECGKIFNSTSYLRQHLKFHLKIKDHACDECDKRFYTATDLRKHKSSHHLMQTHLCGVCGKTYGTRASLNKHVRRLHEQMSRPSTLKCSFCDKMFATPMERKYHEMTHTGEKNFKCELCGHAFRHRYALTQHKIKTHNVQIEGVKLYKQYQKK